MIKIKQVTKIMVHNILQHKLRSLSEYYNLRLLLYIADV